jgi:hypothetical protein
MAIGTHPKRLRSATRQAEGVGRGVPFQGPTIVGSHAAIGWSKCLPRDRPGMRYRSRLCCLRLQRQSRRPDCNFSKLDTLQHSPAAATHSQSQRAQTPMSSSVHRDERSANVLNALIPVHRKANHEGQEDCPTDGIDARHQSAKRSHSV